MSEQRTIEETPAIGVSKCRCCEGSGWIHHPYNQDNLSFTEFPLPRQVVKSTTKESTWQRIRKALGKNR